jgi:hypothetical protein
MIGMFMEFERNAEFSIRIWHSRKCHPGVNAAAVSELN